MYKCDRCGRIHELDESKVMDKQYYVSPYSCTGGAYYKHSFYWFSCDCGRAIEVKKEDLSDPYNIEKDYSDHAGVCSGEVSIKEIRKYKLSRL